MRKQVWLLFFFCRKPIINFTTRWTSLSTKYPKIQNYWKFYWKQSRAIVSFFFLNIFSLNWCIQLCGVVAIFCAAFKIIKCMHDISDIRNPNETFDPMFAYFSNWYRRRLTQHRTITGFIYYLCCCELFTFLIPILNILTVNKYLLFGPSAHQFNEFVVGWRSRCRRHDFLVTRLWFYHFQKRKSLLQ